MFGKTFEAKYTGSMVGSGAMVFAVWDFVITMQRPSREHGSTVEVNPALLAFVLGEPVSAVEAALDKLCQPDPKSRTKVEEGRRLVRLGEFLYRVVNGAKYRAIRDEETRRTQTREAQRRFVSKRKSGGGSAAARVFDQAQRAGDMTTARRVEELQSQVEAGTLAPGAQTLVDEAGELGAFPGDHHEERRAEVEPTKPGCGPEIQKQDAPQSPRTNESEPAKVKTVGNFEPAKPSAPTRPSLRPSPFRVHPV